ncbi:WASH complex, subunit CCDC53 [Kipferlia bialata]|uniref:WASH complex, subunit CCDC53 n=1 Tax=Kipferlia bialata TaxID=797122 RepID=A0A9K3D4V4_9EUKA|nr:WASH complex, subunit CCDC53 [Kipferlia bialata]|eukprot:g9314.t1
MSDHHNASDLTEATLERYSRMPPMDKNKLLRMVNEFVVSTTHFLNRFSMAAERQLSDVRERLTSLESSVIVLETKLLEGKEITGGVPAASAPMPSAPTSSMPAPPGMGAVPMPPPPPGMSSMAPPPPPPPAMAFNVPPPPPPPM